MGSKAFVDLCKKHNGAELTYRRVGQQSSQAICFLPGWCGDRRFWYSYQDAFATDKTVLIIDFPGFGDSQIPRDVTSVEQLSELVTVILVAEGISNCVLVAHSMGGVLALTVAANNPSLVSTVVAVDALTYTELYPEVTEDIADAIVAPFRDDFVAAVRNLVASYFLESSDTKISEFVIEPMAKALPGIAIPILKSCLRWDMLHYLDNYAGPVYAISAKQTFNEQTFSEICGERVRVTTIADTGHFVMLEQPKEFEQKLTKIFKELRQIQCF